MDYAHQAMRSDKDKFESELVESQDEFASELASLMTVVNNFSKYSDLTKTKEIAENVAGINEKLKNCVVTP